MTHPPLTRAPHQPKPALSFLPGLSLTLGRVHEICGNARWRMALWVAAASDGPVFWIRPGWGGGRLHMDAVARLMPPGNLVFVTAKRPDDILWSMEEILRSGAVSTCVAELPEIPALTPIRRLHLAAETGGATAARSPLGVILTPSGGGAPGVESRWNMDADTPNWHLSRTRARMAPEAHWRIPPDLKPQPYRSQALEAV
ncbi:MAG: hypothetical protein AAGD04_04180 [Pseudomonadota bacterium]